MIIRNKKKGKHSNIVVVSEGDEAGSAIEIAKKVKKMTGEDYRVAVLGYIQRGGSPTANDRILASKLGYAAIQTVRRGKCGCLVGMINGKISLTPFLRTYSRKKKVDRENYRIIKVLSV
jgi:6-phosphofructokinase 1